MALATGHRKVEWWRCGVLKRSSNMVLLVISESKLEVILGLVLVQGPS
jgi:predicted cobalt transporter CbtA